MNMDRLNKSLGQIIEEKRAENGTDEQDRRAHGDGKARRHGDDRFYGRGPVGVLTVRNLSYEADERDLRGIFGRYGDVKKIFIDYDRSGRSNGVAEVTYWKRTDADRAFRALNGAKLDDLELRIAREPYRRARRIDYEFEAMLKDSNWQNKPRTMGE